MLALHAKQAMRNHGQTLERLAERGGLSYAEALAVVEDRKFSLVEDAEQQLGALLMAYIRAASAAGVASGPEASSDAPNNT